MTVSSSPAPHAERQRALVHALRKLLPAHALLWQAEDTRPYECDGLSMYRQLPMVVALPETEQQVIDILLACKRLDVPVVARGAGTGLSGGAMPHGEGLLLGLAKFNRIIKVDKTARTAVVQPGVRNLAISEAAAPYGLYYAPDPSSQIACTIGGNVAENSGGVHCLKYGLTVHNVLRVRAITIDGEVIEVGSEAPDAAGLDLLALLIGSEGMLAIVTEITVKLYPLPEAISAAICSFPSIEAAVRTTIEIIQMGVPIARVELIDVNSVRMVNAHSKLSLREEPMLLMEFHGSPTGVKEQAELVQELANGHGGNAFEWASTPEERTRLWAARHNAYFAALQSRPGCRVISTDTCVPISRLADCLLDSITEADASGIPYFLVGHVGDGNFHFGYLIDPTQPKEREIAEALNHQLVSRALLLEGTCTGEHGVGLHKMDFLVTETGNGAVNMMRTIKRALDPKNIMNPGKIFTL